MTVADRRRREREARRNQILDAAERVFLERGFDNVTVDDIAAAAEVAKGTLYLYFKNKEDLLLDLIHRRRRPILQAFGEAQADARNGLDLVARLIRAQHRLLASDPDEFKRLFLRHLVDGPPPERTPAWEEHNKHIGRIIRTYLNAIERGQQDGSIRKDLDPLMITTQIWGGLVGSQVLARHASKFEDQFDRRFDPDEHARSLVDLVIRSIREPGPEPLLQKEAQA